MSKFLKETIETMRGAITSESSGVMGNITKFSDDVISQTEEMMQFMEKTNSLLEARRKKAEWVSSNGSLLILKIGLFV